MLLRNFRYAIRQLLKAPGFTITAVLTLALGIGALTTVATWTKAVVYDPWPHVTDPTSMRFISATVLGSEGYSVHWDAFQFMRQKSRSFSNAAVFTLYMADLMLPAEEPRTMTAGLVSSNYFQFLGLTPQAGRFFDANADDHAYGAHDEIVLSDFLWRERFGASPSAIGRTVQINRHAFTVIGVAPRDFSGIFGGLGESAWMPVSSLRDLSADPAPDPLSSEGLQVAARLPAGLSDAAAAAELHTLAHTLAAEHGDNPRYSHWDLNLRDAAHFDRGLFSAVGQQLPVLFGAAILLMILVCINIASLLGQHAARRRREVAIRTALGATPASIARQVLLETGLLALAGAAGGWAASVVLSRGLYVLLPTFGIPLAFNLRTDVRLLLFVALVAVAVTVVCGMYPVRQTLRVSQLEALHEGGTAVAGGSHKRLGQRILLGIQLAICFVVLVCGGLLTRTALNVAHRDTGFDPNGVLTASFDLSRSGYTEQRGLELESQMLEKLRTAPGVAGATITSHLPMGDYGSGNTQDLAIPGYVPAKGEEMAAVTDFEGPDFFRTFSIPVLQGREFTAQDNATAPGVAVVNQWMAQRYWPKGDAIGHSVTVNKRNWQIVGIVRNYTYHSADNVDPDPILYLPAAQHYVASPRIAIRSRTTADSVSPLLRRAVHDLDPALPLEDIRPETEVAGDLYQFSRIPAELLAVFAIASLLIAMIGLYAVTAYSVIERHREFALRMALGSTRSGVFRLVLRGNTLTASFGLIAGAAASIAAVRLLRSMLFGVTPFDPVSFFAAALLLLFTVLVSGLIPARRAASIQPMQALRSE